MIVKEIMIMAWLGRSIEIMMVMVIMMNTMTMMIMMFIVMTMFMIMYRMAVKLVDWGLSRSHKGGEVLHGGMGSRHFRAPELLLRAAAAGPALDVWSVGCVLAEAATGQRYAMCHNHSLAFSLHVYTICIYLHTSVYVLCVCVCVSVCVFLCVCACVFMCVYFCVCVCVCVC